MELDIPDVLAVGEQVSVKGKRRDADMKIVIIAPFWNPPHFKGGISRVIYELRKIWVEQGHTVHVFASDTVTERAHGIFRMPIPPVPLRGVWNSIYLRASHRLDSYDVIFPQTITECILLDKEKCLPFIHTLSKVEHKVPWRFWRHAHEPIEKLALKDIKSCITLTEDIKQTVLTRFNFPRLNIVKIHNGVDYDAFCPGHGQNPQTFRILSAGRFIPRKRFDLLIRAFALFAKTRADAQLVIAGDGYLGDELKSLARELNVQDRIYFPGLVDGDRMLQLYQSASVFVLASVSEGMPMVVLEAQSCGLPVIIGDFESSREVIDENRTGFIVRTDNPEDWKERLSVLYQDLNLRQKLGSEARERIIAHFGWDRVAENIMAQFRELLSGIH